jgi:L-fucose isomerase-like protein
MANETATPATETALFLGGLPTEYLEQWDITSDLELIRRKLGVLCVTVPTEEVMERFEALTGQPSSLGTEMSRQLRSEAAGAIPEGMTEEDVERAVRFYLVIRELLDEHDGDAVTIVCRTFREAGAPVPCVALNLMQEDGVPAACQGDVDALLTMILLRRAGASSSFMGNPGEQEGKLAVSHCVLSRRMVSSDGASSSYSLAPYHGDATHPTILTDLPEGQPVTVARLTRDLKGLILTSGTLCGSLDEPGMCTNGLLIDVPNLHEVLDTVLGNQYHLVVACGDYIADLSSEAERIDAMILP